MSMPNVPAEDAPPGAETPPDGADAPRSGNISSPEEYGGLSVEDDPDGTVDPGELAGGANENDEDVS